MQAKKRRKTKKRKSSPDPKKNSRRKKKRNTFIRSAVKLHTTITVIVVILYLTFGMLLDPSLLFGDLQKKYAQAATVTVSLWVPGPPGKPAIATQAGCNGTSPYISLSWNPTTDTDSYDIYRNGEPLITGLLFSPYRNDNVQAGVSYSYHIVANGSLGHTQSDEINVTPSGCYTPPPPSPPPPSPPPPPVIAPATINGKDISCLTKTTKTSAQSSVPVAYSNTARPFFSGTTNIANAKIKITLVWKKTVVISTLQANDNGYWSWRPPKNLKKKYYTLYIAATDPKDPTQTTETSINLTVQPGKKIKETCTPNTIKSASPLYPKSFPAPSLEIASQGNQNKPIASGQVLGEEISLVAPDKSSFGNKNTINYILEDPQGKIILSQQDSLPSNLDQPLLKNFSIPRFSSSGDYKLLASTIASDGTLLTAEKNFAVQESPLLNMGGTMSFTYTDILNKMGWFAVVLIAILGLLLSLSLFEWVLSRRAAIGITEEELGRGGFIS